MIAHFGARTWAFLLFVCTVLAVLAYASSRLRPWAWHLALLVYGVGVVVGLWQVSMGSVRVGLWRR
jgi:nitrate/nitrite transporter NarK